MNHTRGEWRDTLQDVEPAANIAWLDITRGLSGLVASCGWVDANGDQWTAVYDPSYMTITDGRVFRIEQFVGEPERPDHSLGIAGHVPEKFLLWIVCVGWAEQSRLLWDAMDEYVDARYDGEWNGNLPPEIRKLEDVFRGPAVPRRW